MRVPGCSCSVTASALSTPRRLALRSVREHQRAAVRFGRRPTRRVGPRPESMAALLKGFNRFPQPEPGPELLANASVNLLVPWWRRGGMGIFEHGAILSEFVPALLLLHMLCFQPLSFVLTTPGAIVALAIPSWFTFREGICTGDGSVIASILVPLYFLSIVLSLPGLPHPSTTLCVAVVMTVAKLAVCMSAVLHRWAAHGAFKCSYPVSLLLEP